MGQTGDSPLVTRYFKWYSVGDILISQHQHAPVVVLRSDAVPRPTTELPKRRPSPPPCVPRWCRRTHTAPFCRGGTRAGLFHQDLSG